MKTPAPATPPPDDRLLGCLARIVWMIAAPAALFLSAFLIAERRALAGIPAHLLLPSAVALAVAVRWLDVTVLRGHTADGEPATLADWRRYAGLVVAIGAGLWLLATVVARLGWFH